jgi:hypothetical protein
MHLLFDIFQGMGVAAAVGIRPFLPALAASALAAGDVEIHFTHTRYHFLQQLPFIFVMVIGAVALISIGASFSRQLEGRAMRGGLSLISLALGALFFAGSLCRDGYAAWPGWVGGVICAVIAVAAAQPFLSRLRARLDAETAAIGVPVIADGSALLVAVLSVVAPPIGVIAVLALLWLLYQGRQGGDAKYAGLRILR